MTPDETPAETPQTPDQGEVPTTTPEAPPDASAKRRSPHKPKLEEWAVSAANRWLHFFGLSQRTHDYRKLARSLQEEHPTTVSQIVKLVAKSEKERK